MGCTSGTMLREPYRAPHYYEVTAAGIYFAAVTVNGCTGISNAIEVVVNPTPTPIIDTDDALIYCEENLLR